MTIRRKRREAPGRPALPWVRPIRAMDRRRFVKTAGGVLVAGQLSACNDVPGSTTPTGPTGTTGILGLMVTGLEPSATSGGTVTVTPVDAPGATQITVPVPVSGVGETTVPVGTYSVEYAAPAGHVLAPGAANPQNANVVEGQTTVVDFSVAVVVAPGTLQIIVTGLGTAATGGSAQITRTDIAGQAPITVDVPTSGTMATSLVPGTYDVNYVPPGGFALSSGVTNPQSVVVTSDSTVTATFQVALANSGPDIAEISFEDGTVGSLQDNVGGAAQGTVISTDAARGTRCLQVDYGPTPVSEGGVAINFKMAGAERIDTWIRFAMKHVGRPTAIQKIWRVQGIEGVPKRGLGTLTLSGSSSSDAVFSWFWDDHDTGGGSRVEVNIDDIVNEWHWWEFHHLSMPGQPLRIEIFVDDVLLLDEQSPVVNSNNQMMQNLIFDGTLNLGNTVDFAVRFDEFGISSTKMGIPA